ncbi:PREDICTED: COMM domain-containing protein 10 [Dinoponera quadriceps]|uniref:COMM domain-containing protein 10 n=1 Tax=Dinoponera quadriceps TaxID=609295 RepID=A0A6P3XVL6_DINQU|nr:PREDICTED: COMM domain-containing protein 10 [Dinoponera quadriceps]
MMAAWISITPKLEQGLKIVSRVDNSKFRLLVNRICQSLQSSIDTKVFSEEEEEKLLVSLDLTKDELTLLLDTVTSIYTQAACNIVKPSVMEAVMRDNLKIDDEKISIFTNAWMTYGKGIVENLRQKSIFPTQVKDINWCLNVQSSSSTISKDARPVALLQLGLTGDKTSTLTVEFDKKQLTSLYYNLEKIQTQLDALN